MQRPDRPFVGQLPAIGLAVVLGLAAPAAIPREAPEPPPPAAEAEGTPVPALGAAQVEGAPTVRVTSLGAVESRTAALLLSGQEGGNLPGVLVWCAEPVPTPEGRIPIRLYIELDGGVLLQNASPERVPLAVFAYALDDSGRIVGHLAHGVLVAGPGTRGALASGGLKFVARTELPPGTISLRLIARIYGTEAFFLTRQDFRLALPGSGEPTISAPLFAQREGTWLTVLQEGLGEAAGCSQELVPSAMPVLDVSRPMEYGVTGTSWPADARVVLSVVDPQGRVLDDPVLEAGEPRAIAGSGVELTPFEIPPFDVPPGGYRLRLRLLDGTGEELASSYLPAVLLPIDAPAGWAGLDELARGETEPTPTPVADDEVSDREMRRGYLAALRLLAEGDQVAARRALAELERGVLAAESAKGLLQMRRTELKVAGQLARRVPKSLPPVVLLHRDLYRTYSAYSESALASHSWLVAAELAEEVGLETRWPPPERFAEGVLVSLATEVVQSSAPVTGAELLERALALNPTYGPALIGLAALRERQGDRTDAVDVLERLVASDPGNPEGRLRLGVNLARLGRTGAAERVLRSLLAGSPPEWILSIAAEELARLLVGDKRLDAAEEVLRGTIARVANNQRLAISLAWVLDLAGRPSEAVGVLEGVEALAGRRFDSARMRYSQWPEMGIYEIRASLRQAAEERLPDLREALE